MRYVRARTFCCCLPVRLGVFVMSGLATAGNGFVSVVAWIAVDRVLNHKDNLDHNAQIALEVFSAVFTLMTIISLAGFIGCLARNRATTRIFSWLNWVLFLFSLVAGGLGIYGSFHRNDFDTEAFNDCIKDHSGKTDTATTDKCHSDAKTTVAIVKALIVLMFVAYWAIVLYGCHIVSSYVTQLEEEEDAERRYGRISSFAGTSTNQVNDMEMMMPRKDASYYP